MAVVPCRREWPLKEHTMHTVTYSDMAERHGHDQAYMLLKGMERIAQVRDDIIHFDRDIRFRRAFEALCEIDFA